MGAPRNVGEVVLAIDNISLAFGGVRALAEVSFDVRAHEIRAIIGPNGAGKSSMLNVINGVYHPQQGSVTFKGVTRRQMRPHEAARQGIARTFQNIALFKGMTVLDNIMTGRNLKMHAGFFAQAVWFGPARNELSTGCGRRTGCEKAADCLTTPFGVGRRTRALDGCRSHRSAATADRFDRHGADRRSELRLDA